MKMTDPEYQDLASYLMSQGNWRLAKGILTQIHVTASLCEVEVQRLTRRVAAYYLLDAEDFNAR